MNRLVLYGMTVFALLISSSTWAESVYRCPDGTFTNNDASALIAALLFPMLA